MKPCSRYKPRKNSLINYNNKSPSTVPLIVVVMVIIKYWPVITVGDVY